MNRLILASASRARAEMLRNAGVAVETVPAQVDEAAMKRKMLNRGDDSDQIAASLAQAKATDISTSQPDAFVIGADQILIHAGRLFDKPRSMAEAAAHLRILRGSKHRLISAVSVAIGGTEIWAASGNADLTMRDFSDTFLDEYLEAFGEKALTSVGAYHLESLGAQLFERVEGDYFTVLGLPLLKLLEFLRERSILEA